MQDDLLSAFKATFLDAQSVSDEMACMKEALLQAENSKPLEKWIRGYIASVIWKWGMSEPDQAFRFAAARSQETNPQDIFGGLAVLGALNTRYKRVPWDYKISFYSEGYAYNTMMRCELDRITFLPEGVESGFINQADYALDQFVCEIDDGETVSWDSYASIVGGDELLDEYTEAWEITEKRWPIADFSELAKSITAAQEKEVLERLISSNQRAVDETSRKMLSL